jgi:hypothetical protein
MKFRRFNQLAEVFVSALFFNSALVLSAATYVVAQRDPGADDSGLGSREHPWRTLGPAAERAMAGDRVVIEDGEYRESLTVRASGTSENPIRFESAAGAHVVVTGADPVAGWVKAEAGRPIYQVAWRHKFNTWSPHMTHPDDEYHRLIGRCEQVVVAGYLLRQVLQSNQLAPGTFYVDIPNQVLFAWDTAGHDLNKIPVQASTRQELLRVEGSYVQWHGINFRYAANAAQHGAVVLLGHHSTLENCVVDRMNANGATFSASNLVVRGCVFRDNGQIGFGANGAHALLVTECLVEDNNTKGFDRDWEAGGNKLVLCRGAVLERCRFIRNRGNGVWFDIGNENCVVRQCLIADNEDAGIFNEISYGLHVQDNIIAGNGFATTPGAWGAQAGVVLSSSPASLVERNLIVGNREGFNFREQSRTTPRINEPREVPVWNHNELIRYNVIAYNRDAQIWGWFDVADARHWQVTSSTEADLPVTSPGAPTDDLAAHYKAQAADVGPGRNLTLKDLHIRFENNIYFAGPAQRWFEWGVTWRRHRSYANLHDFQNELGVDNGSAVFEPRIADLSGWDFRLAQADMARCQNCYPRGEVPGVLVGNIPSGSP